AFLRPDAPFTTAESPRAVELRSAYISAAAAAIEAECYAAAGGDWSLWLAQTAAPRATFGCRVEALVGRDGFPLFEMWPYENLQYLHDPDSILTFRKSHIVQAASRWLAKRGIDLIFVPVPKMAEVYAEHFPYPCPEDGVVGPHVRQALLELLDDGVE